MHVTLDHYALFIAINKKIIKQRGTIVTRNIHYKQSQLSDRVKNETNNQQPKLQ